MNPDIEFKPATPKDAAAILVMRDGKVLWARRNPDIKFLGGFHAFPGGKTDPDDWKIDVANCADAEMAAMIACAVREVFEEVGVLLARGGDTLTKGQRASLHDDLVSGRSNFAEILSNWGLWIDAADFSYTGFWTTPQFSPVRFKTRFFIAECPPKQEPYAAITELEAIEFIEVADALDQWRRSEVLITPPVLIHLQEMVKAGVLKPESFAGCAASLRELSDADDGNIDHIEMNPHVLCVPLRTKTLPPATHTNCFVVGRREFVVIDAASPFAEEQEKLIRVVDQLISAGGRCRAIIVSHLHTDHFGGESMLQRHFKERHGLEVQIAGHPETIADLAGKVVFQTEMKDGEMLELTDAAGERFELEVLHTPGHARGHLAFYDRDMCFLLSSDNVVGVGTVVIAPPQGDMTEYLGSLERMRDLPGLRFLAGSHGAAVYDAVGRIEGYIAHRLEREKQVKALMDQGLITPEEIAAEIYTGLDERLMPLAVRTVMAHLEKIAADQRKNS